MYQALDDDRRTRFGYREKAAVVSAAIRERNLARVAELLVEAPELAVATDETGNAPIHRDDRFVFEMCTRFLKFTRSRYL